MHYENKKYNMLENESSKDNELLLNDSDLSSIKQKIRELETKMSGLPKDNKINKIYQSNYSFSDKTLGNEISRAKTESLEQELLSFVKKPDNKLNKKEKPIYLSHSDYYYCPELKTKKFQIYLILIIIILKLKEIKKNHLKKRKFYKLL